MRNKSFEFFALLHFRTPEPFIRAVRWKFRRTEIPLLCPPPHFSPATLQTTPYLRHHPSATNRWSGCFNTARDEENSYWKGYDAKEGHTETLQKRKNAEPKTVFLFSSSIRPWVCFFSTGQPNRIWIGRCL